LLGFVIYDNISFLLELGEMSPELVDTYFEENTGIVLTFLVQLFVAGGAAIIATWAYSVIPAITRWQGTLGKRILGLAMVRSSDGGPVGLWRATGRFLAFGAIF